MSGAGNILKAILPIAIAFVAPELAPVLGITSTLGTAALGAGLGAGGGLLTGGGIKGALEGGLAGGLGAGGGDLLAGSAGLGDIGTAALSKGLTGAATGLFTGGTPLAALEGGVLGAGGGALNASGGLSGLLGGGASNAGDAGLGDINGLSITPSTVDNAGLGGAGVLPGASDVGAAGLATSGGGGALAGGGASSYGGVGSSDILSGGTSSVAGGGGGDTGTKLMSLLSGGSNAYAQNQAENQLVKSQEATQAELAPYLKGGAGAENALSTALGTNGNTTGKNFGALTTPFTGADLQNEPGYQFNLSQGTQALQNAESATGNLDSGAALKAAEQFGQGLAGTTYNQAFNRDLATKQQLQGALSGAAGTGLNATDISGQVNNNIGSAESKGTIAQNNSLVALLSALQLGNGSKNIVGYKQDGTPIYS